MKRKKQILFGVVAILFTLISAGIGFGLLSGLGSASSTIQYVLRFFLTITPVITTLAVINLLKKDI